MGGDTPGFFVELKRSVPHCQECPPLACGLWAGDTPSLHLGAGLWVVGEGHTFPASRVYTRYVPRKRLHLKVTPPCRTTCIENPSVACVAGDARWSGGAAAGGGRSEVKRSRAGSPHGEPRTESPSEAAQPDLRTGVTAKKHAVLFTQNGHQNRRLAENVFLPRFSLTARGRHHIL